MYNNKLAVAIKSNGKVLREFGENVYVPFGSEYSILVKNLNSVRALVTITIDGTDTGDGEQFVVDANDSLELERFLKNGNKKKGNRFKFIERSDSVEEHRGIDVEDGLVRVEYQFEKPLPKIEEIFIKYREVCPSPSPWDPYQPRIWYNNSGNPPPFGAQYTTCDSGEEPTGPGELLRSMSISSSMAASGEEPVSVNFCANENGITVPGSISEQEFKTVSSFPVESETHVIVLKMLGETDDNKRVRKPVTVKAKIECETCGKKNKATDKFCSECGTSLTIV